MNIFFLDSDPYKSAKYQCDKHVIKMTLETAQLLSTAHRLNPYDDGKDTLPDFIYKPTHKNHPCAIWAREFCSNYSWLSLHGLYLAEEYERRYGKRHKCFELLDWCIDNFPNIPFGFGEFSLGSYSVTEPPQCMPERYKIQNKPIEAYRNYYINDKMKKMKCVWTNREKPEWI